MWRFLYAVNEGATDVANGAPEGGQAAQNPLSGLLPMLVVFFAIMYFFMIRPNQKREKQRREMLASLSKGDRVVTSGGICGTIVGLTEKSVVLRVDDEDNVKMEFVRGAISQVTSTGDDDED